MSNNNYRLGRPGTTSHKIGCGCEIVADQGVKKTTEVEIAFVLPHPPWIKKINPLAVVGRIKRQRALIIEIKEFTIAGNSGDI
ncbi:hypothetical protein A2311_02610 [candidate division WOR-1 bacterium RIFOXYB2_FULL_48_7]|uniref:Uncharacterized protein n=1 Tax=candidate division WOR-1 bacterium RIFOXYB2_FULL_48_7 TaxID=1802583 RepID=A0A1F4TQZ9_UNCSA|nr:MAG: hypothetical protein A2311_02610 [candidate division WOR-1 bacterium RIFOXYB2_FULL_48_7]